MRTVTFLSTLLLFITVSAVNAQVLRGKIYEQTESGAKTPLIGANVFWLGTTLGAATNTNGEFSIDYPKESNHKLVVSFVGFETDTVTISHNQSFLEHTLSQSVAIDGVVFTGKAKGAHFDRISPMQTQIVTSAELQRAACCNLSESFETNASVDVSYSDAVSGAKQIQLLGLAGTYTQLQAENIPTLRGLGSVFGLYYVPGSWMESIQVSKGTASVANGYESLTGQINIEYKKPWNEERMYFNIYQNNLGMTEVNANASIDVSKKVSTMLLVHGENMTNKVDHNEDSFVDHPLIKQYHIFNRWKYQGDKIESQVGIKILDESRISGQKSYTSGNTSVPGQPFGVDVKTQRQEGFLKVGYIFNRPSTSLGFIAAASNHDQESMFGSNLYNADQQSVHSNLVFVSYIGNTSHGIKTGVNFNFDKYNEVLNGTTYNREERVPGVYFEYTYKFLDKLTLMAGVRYDNHNQFGDFVTPRVHFRYQPAQQVTLRASAGRGLRSPAVIAENAFLLSSSKQMELTEPIEMEDAWNYGLNITQRYNLWDREFTLSTDYYHTKFVNQLVVDMDQDATKILFYNLKGRSYSNSFQVEASYSPFTRFDVTAAYRLNDVKTTIDGTLKQKPLVSEYKGLLTFGYKTPFNKWQFDYTIQLNGGGTLPSNEQLPAELQRKSTFPSYTTMNAQITKLFRKWELYVGVENLTGFKQDNPIISAADPYNTYFDATQVWGPLTGRKFYAGIRMSIYK